MRRLEEKFLAAIPAGIGEAMWGLFGLAIAARLATIPMALLTGAELPDPPGFLRWLEAPPGRATILGLQVTGTVAGLTAAGAAITGRRRSAYSCFFGAWMVLLFLAGIRGGFGKVLHNDVLLLLAAVPWILAGTTTIDSTRETISGWPRRLSLALVASGYFMSGIQKLRSNGISWATSDNMRYVLLQGAGRARFPPLNIAVAETGWIPKVLAMGALTFELSALIILFTGRLRGLYAAAATAMHLSIWLFMTLDYWTWIATCWIVMAPPLTLIDRTRSRFASRAFGGSAA